MIRPGEGFTIMDVQEYSEHGITYTVRQRVFRADYERDGTEPIPGYIERIELDGDEATYWIKWLGTEAADPHGHYAFWVAEHAFQMEHGGIDALVRSADGWGVRLDSPQVRPAKVTAYETEHAARSTYHTLRDLSRRGGVWVRDI
jgi:hypothetical protein